MTEDLEFHFLELPKFNKGADELTTGLDMWLYFLRHAETMDVTALPTMLEQPIIRRATEVLKMLTQSEIEREKYEARLKYQLDQNTVMMALKRAEELVMRAKRAEQEGREEGRQEGRQEGKHIGLIHAYQQLLNRPETPDEQLLALPLEELVRLAQDLKRQATAHR
jgi:predicted transposase/invertase (TIGR01784 family)